MRRTVRLAVFVLVCAGCGKPTEEQRLRQFRRSVKYKTYRLASEKATKLAVAEYNRTASQPVNDRLVHSTLGLVWFLSEKSEYSFIEADIVGKGDTNDLRTLSLCLKSIALSKMKYPRLSRSHYEELRSTLARQQNVDTNTIEMEHKLFLLGLIAVSLYHGDPETAKFGADALGAITQLDYLPPLVGAVVEAKKGSTLKALAQLRELNKSKRFSEHKRAVMAEVADTIANCPDKEKLGDELTRRVLVQLVQRVLEDIFTAEKQRGLLNKTRTLPDLIMGKKHAQPSSAGTFSAGERLRAQNPERPEQQTRSRLHTDCFVRKTGRVAYLHCSPIGTDERRYRLRAGLGRGL